MNSGGGESGREYLEMINADFYLNDVISMILKTQPENPLLFMNEYFKSVYDMDHVVNKRFSYINATSHNRRAFLFSCTRAFGHFGDGQEVAIGDLYQLVTLLCSDYPEARIYEIPRLLRSSPSVRIPFGDLRVAFYVHFAYYDFLLDLKHIFCQISRPSDAKGGDAHDSSSSRRRLGWHAVDLAAVEARSEEYSARMKGQPFCCVPSKFIRIAYKDVETLTFDEFVYRLLTNQELALELREPVSSEWQRRDATEEVAALFQKRNARGEAGPEEESDRFTKATKPRSKERTKDKKKKVKD